MGSRERYLVTGAAGFVGARLARTLRASGGDVHGVVSPSSNTWRLDGDDAPVLHVVDLRDRDAVRRLVADVRPTIIYNLASHGAYPHQTDAARIFGSNVLGLTHLLEACEAIDYRLLVHAGSSSEYGRKSAAMREDDELAPETLYGVSKVAQSLLCQRWARLKGRPVTVLRLFSVYGPLEEPTRLVPRLLTSMLDAQPIAMASPVTSRDFIHVDDVVAAMLKVDGLAALSGTVLNLGTGIQTTLAEMVGTLESLAGRPLLAEWNTMPARPWDTETWVADISRLRQALGWTPALSVRDGLAQSIEWFRANRGCYPVHP